MPRTEQNTLNRPSTSFKIVINFIPVSCSHSILLHFTKRQKTHPIVFEPSKQSPIALPIRRGSFVPPSPNSFPHQVHTAVFALT